MKHLTLLAAFAIWVVLSITAAFADTSTSVTLTYGDWIAQIAPLAGFLIIVVVMIILAMVVPKLPSWVQALYTPQIRAMLLAYTADAINWGIQRVQNAEKGKEVTVQVGSTVLAVAAQRLLQELPAWLQKWAGGSEGIKKWVITQAEDHGLILPADSTALQVLEHPAMQAVAKSPQ